MSSIALTIKQSGISGRWYVRHADGWQPCQPQASHAAAVALAMDEVKRRFCVQQSAR